ncbi:UMP kinase [Thermosulfurimonas marina]|uniref:Uridylate kinase n=1 Tax=Thermosulfurimonas marina TaxID=2047767 RepID=A0A6H1WQD1_9BACT|nr:UMP kinase [Thermosulfurimonas marina]QJA05346.1 UMP kinase [Thermosulfurimonas marina]
MPRYRRILLKLSGEALGEGGQGLSWERLSSLGGELAEARKRGTELALVVGGGNILRGASAKALDRVRADYMGMLATFINALALEEVLKQAGVPARVLSALSVEGVGEPFHRERALEYLARGEILILACGTGNPLFTTDTAAVLRALELRAEVLFKGTKVDGVYEEDPVKNPAARKYDYLSYEEVLEKGLGVMDLTAITLAREHHLPVLVFNMLKSGNIVRAVSGETVGTLIGG